MRLEAACHTLSRLADGRKRDVSFGCIEASDIWKEQDMIDDYSNGLSSARQSTGMRAPKQLISIESTPVALK